MIGCKSLTAQINYQYVMLSDAKVMTLIMGMMDSRQMHKEVLLTTSLYDIRTNVKNLQTLTF